VTIEFTTLAELFPPEDLDRAIAQGWIRVNRHPELPLSVYTYTRTCVFENRWTPATTRCRGLIADDDTGRVVAHCLPKFFGHGEHGRGLPYAPDLPDTGFEIQDKEDGSLGHVFHHAGRWHAASKGAFTSEQAVWAREWLDERDLAGLDPHLTYVTEIIHPANRIVVDNGSERGLVLLAVLGPDGREPALADHAHTWRTLGGRVVRAWPATSLTDLVGAAAANRLPDGTPTNGAATEGWVLRYPNGTRVKIKLADYVRLHTLMTGIDERDIWHAVGLRRLADHPAKAIARALTCAEAEVTSPTRTMEALLDRVPDELDAWARRVAAGLTTTADQREAEARAAFALLTHVRHDPKAFAQAARSHPDRDITTLLFLLRTDHPIALPIWRTLKPPPESRFTHDPDAL